MYYSARTPLVMGRYSATTPTVLSFSSGPVLVPGTAPVQLTVLRQHCLVPTVLSQYHAYCECPLGVLKVKGPKLNSSSSCKLDYWECSCEKFMCRMRIIHVYSCENYIVILVIFSEVVSKNFGVDAPFQQKFKWHSIKISFARFLRVVQASGFASIIFSQ